MHWLTVLALFVLPWFCHLLELPPQSIPESISVLYDARTGRFSPFQLIPKSRLREFLSYEDMSGTTFENMILRTETDIFKAKHIGVDAELNIRLGLLNLGASGSFIHSAESKSSAKKVVGYSNFVQETSLMSIDFCDEGVKQATRGELLYSNEFTHVVQSIVLGVELDVTGETENTDEEDSSVLESKITAGFDYAFQKGNIEAEYSSKVLSSVKSSKFKIRSKCNIGTQGFHPSNFEDIHSFLDNIPIYLNHTNGARGGPLRLILKDISVVRNCLDIKKDPPFSFDVDETFMANISHVLNNIDTKRQEFSYMKSFLFNFKQCFPGTHVNDFDNLIWNFDRLALDFRQTMKTDMISIRSGNLAREDVSKKILEYETNTFSPAKVTETIELLWPTIQSKLEIYKLSERYNVSCVSGKSSLNQVVVSNLPKRSHFFSFNITSVAKNGFMGTLSTFLQACKNPVVNYNHKCQIIDCEIGFTDCKSIGSYDVLEYPYKCSSTTNETTKNLLQIHVNNKKRVEAKALKIGKSFLDAFEKNGKEKNAIIDKLHKKRDSMAKTIEFVNDRAKYLKAKDSFENNVVQRVHSIYREHSEM